MVAYPLEAFRVHKVIRSDPNSQIPANKDLIVIDVGDSRLAPHQSVFPADKPMYFYRQGGKSIPAPHHYLEALRNRLTYAVLNVDMIGLQVVAVNRQVLEDRDVATLHCVSQSRMLVELSAIIGKSFVPLNTYPKPE